MKLLSKNTKKTWIHIIAILTFALFAFFFTTHLVLQTKAQTNQASLPVILVHGYNNKPGNCQGINLNSYWLNVKTELTSVAALPATDVVPVSYYRCDTGGIDMTGYGPDKSYPFTVTKGAIKPRVSYTNNASITTIARELAWFIYNEYTLKNRPVNVVGHSMGGLITREALRRMQAGDSSFPPTLEIHNVLTMSTPHNGWGVVCKANTQCREMTDGSDFLQEIQSNPAPQGSGGTHWWAMATGGSSTGRGWASACDSIPTSSAIAVEGTHLVYTKPCYRHNGYLNDKSQQLDAVGSPELGGRHSLAMMVEILR